MPKSKSPAAAVLSLSCFLLLAHDGLANQVEAAGPESSAKLGQQPLFQAGDLGYGSSQKNCNIDEKPGFLKKPGF